MSVQRGAPHNTPLPLPQALSDRRTRLGALAGNTCLPEVVRSIRTAGVLEVARDLAGPAALDSSLAAADFDSSHLGPALEDTGSGCSHYRGQDPGARRVRSRGRHRGRLALALPWVADRSEVRISDWTCWWRRLRGRRVVG